MEIIANTTLKADIDIYEQKRITEKFLMELFKIPGEKCYINNKGQLIRWWEESMGQHHSTEKEVIRKATNSDKLYFKFRGQISELYELEIEE